LIDADGAQLGIRSTSEARALAEKQGLDLVEISPTANPPVCKIMNYGKFKYDQEKKSKDARKNQGSSRIKEVKYHVNVEEHDFQTKLRHIQEFIDGGHRVKVSLFFRGRENAHPELGYEVMKHVIAAAEPFASPESMPSKMGRAVIMILGPRRGQTRPGAPTPAPAPAPAKAPTPTPAPFRVPGPGRP
jgi:translation initiation factor IF-3